MNNKDLELLIEKGEGYKLEFKESLNNTLGKELVAFANASGGTILLGIGDDKTIKGITITNDLISKIQDIANNCEPQIKINIKQADNVLIINIVEGNDKPYQCSGGFFLRIGPNSQKLNRNQIIDFLQSESKIRFEELICSKFIYTKHFDAEKLNRYLNLSGIRKSNSHKIILQNLDVANLSENKNISFNNAGALFFSKNLTHIYEHTTITCALFDGNERIKIINRKEFNDDIISNIDDALWFITKELKVKYEMAGKAQRNEIYEIPIDAIREALVNAVCHRDYFEKGAHTVVEIFDNRIEITNPGGLVKGMTIKDFGKIAIRRNPIIASLLYRAKYVENMGTGINKIKELIKSSGANPVDFEIKNFFKVIFKRQMDFADGTVNDAVKIDAAVNGTVKVAENKAITNYDAVNGTLKIDEAVNGTVNGTVKIDEAVNEAVNEAVKARLCNEILYLFNDGATIQRLIEKFNISRRSLMRDMKLLKDAGLVEFKGSSKTGKYILTEFMKRKIQ